jgi:hypothetical protein
MNRLLLGIFLALLGTVALYGQETDYQRYDLERKQRELILESGVKSWTEAVNGFSCVLYEPERSGGIYVFNPSYGNGKDAV